MRQSVIAILLALCGLPVLAQQGASSLTVIQPCRLYDSRIDHEEPLAIDTTYQLPVRGYCGVPEDANAVFMTVVAVGASAGGNVKIWASDLNVPTASTLNFRGNGNDSSATFARLCAPPLLECSGVDMSFRIAISPTHVILDVVGYTEPIE